MSDRFKFRVWAKPDEKTNTDGYYVDDADYIAIHPDGTAEITYCVDDGYAGQIVHFEQDEIIVEQCTGLKDKNGKLIYDGDIVKISSNTDREVISPVVWDDKETGFCIKYKEELFRFNTYREYHKLEIIGNIHEKESK